VLCLKHFDELHKYVQREGIMIQHFLRLEQVLLEENKFYDDIYALEIEKATLFYKNQSHSCRRSAAGKKIFSWRLNLLRMKE
jgi:hypothetical protein